ncbi:hypothetical protein AGMMS49959_15310 [Planctomycetales bacterium]|nr:hypothetical protein AGMMS49959_15310 [Planctomycetales bacterium]
MRLLLLIFALMTGVWAGEFDELAEMSPEIITEAAGMTEITGILYDIKVLLILLAGWAVHDVWDRYARRKNFY